MQFFYGSTYHFRFFPDLWLALDVIKHAYDVTRYDHLHVRGVEPVARAVARDHEVE